MDPFASATFVSTCRTDIVSTPYHWDWLSASDHGLGKGWVPLDQDDAVLTVPGYVQTTSTVQCYNPSVSLISMLLMLGVFFTTAIVTFRIWKKRHSA